MDKCGPCFVLYCVFLHTSQISAMPLISFRKTAQHTAAAVVVGFLAGLLALSLKHLTEYYQDMLLTRFEQAPQFWFLLPLAGLLLIAVLRRVFFNGKTNKGMAEIMHQGQPTARKLPHYKIPSHFLNGLLTVGFGGSTGIEVSTVVASATIGSAAPQKQPWLKKYRKAFLAAGVAAGVTGLFASPLAGILFAWEVLYPKSGKGFFKTVIPAVATAFLLVWLAQDGVAFAANITQWHWHALPYLMLLAVAAAANSVYLTRTVLFFKHWFFGIENSWLKIVCGALLLGALLFFVPALYGDGYHGVRALIQASGQAPALIMLIPVAAALLLKPLATAITLACGGDGGVFAPSLFVGAFLGFSVATAANVLFGADVIVINFVVIGMAASLSASIHAPFTALFLVCALVNNYVLLAPMLAVCLLARWTAGMLFPYTVYSYAKKSSC